MTRIWYDAETYSPVDIKLGVYRYVEHPEFGVMVSSIAVDDSDVVTYDHTAGERLPTWVAEAAKDPSVEWVAHNSGFDRVATKAAGLFDVPIERWHCTMVQAMLHGLPGKLERLCEIFKLPEELAKMDEGKALIQLFCKPRPASWNLRRATRDTHPEEWARFLEYGEHDILAMRALYSKIPMWNYGPQEKRLWFIDQRSNDRGIACDLELVDAAIETIDRETKRLNKRGEALTEGDVTRLGQRDKLLQHLLAEYQVALPDLRASTIERRLQDEALPEWVRELLALRLESSKASTSKYKMMRNSANDDGRLRGLIQFSGAPRTRRDGGRRVQPQNFVRIQKGYKNLIEQGIAAIKSGDTELFDNVMELCSQVLRGALVAGPGKRLVAADLSNIEGRDTAWLAGEHWKLKAFREFDQGIGHDLYLLSYAKAFSKSIEEVLQLHEAGENVRQLGKVNELACGYQGAVGAWQTMAALYGIEVEDEVALRNVKAWRAGHPATVALWYRLEACAREAILRPGRTVAANDKLAFEKWKAWLVMHLPSGRRLCYPQATVDGEDRISYMGVDPYTRRWRRLNAYGGKFTENSAQTVARDVLFDALPEVEDTGFDILLRVHDEVVAEVDEDSPLDHTDLARILSRPHAWCKDLPLAASGFTAHRFSAKS